MPIKVTVWKLSSLLTSDFNLLVRAWVRDEGVSLCSLQTWE